MVFEERSKNHIIAKELEPFVKELAEEIHEKEVEKEAERGRELAEALSLRSRGMPLSEVLERTGVPKTTFYRIEDMGDVDKRLKEYEEFMKQIPRPSPSIEPPQTMQTDNQAIRNEKYEQPKYVIEIPIEKDNLMVDSMRSFMESMDGFFPLPPLSDVLGKKVSFKCPKCNEIIYVKKPRFSN